MKLFTAAEIAAMGLPGLPSTKANVIARATREGWYFEEQKGVGGTRRVYAVPEKYLEGTSMALPTVATAASAGRADEGEPTWEDFLQVPLYAVKASAGHGAHIDREHVKKYLAFRRDFIRDTLGIEHTDFYCVSVDGVSMEPVLRHGHPVLIDARSTEVLREGPYLLRLEGALLLKNLQRLPGGRLRIWSENQTTSAYPPIEMAWPPAEGTDLQIFGRVRWSDVVF